MDWVKICAAVVPCLNESGAIGAVVTKARRHVGTVLVVDDGSTDGTAKVAEAHGATVLRHSSPQGKGAALRTGWAHAWKAGFSWALALDGDGQHAPEDIPKFFESAAQGDALLISGSRMHATQTMPIVRKWTNRFMSWQLSKVAGVPLEDSQCGYRLMHLPSWSQLPIHTNCFEIESEVLLRFARARLGIRFVPIQVIYAREKSKIRPVRDTIRWFRWLSDIRRQNP